MLQASKEREGHLGGIERESGGGSGSKSEGEVGFLGSSATQWPVAAHFQLTDRVL